MAYFLRIHSRSRGQYLQIDESFRDKEKKQTCHRSYKTLGYVDDLIASGIPDPISFYKNVVDELNLQKQSSSIAKISDKPVRKNVGHFLLKALIDKLDIEQTVFILSLKRDFQFKLSDLIRQLIYSRVVNPCSKSKTADSVFPYLYNSKKISSDQVYDGIEFIGENYKKYIELFNTHYAKIYGRKTGVCYFDYTNYYFEIDLPKEDKQKGPSKENRTEPIIGQALLLDENQIPIAMEMYPGNESEKPYIRKLISNMKERYNISGKTVQVADKGLNCGQNIFEALKNKDGYVFSKSVHGKNLSDIEKKWVLLDNDYVIVNDDKGNPLYKIKECVDDFEYKFEIDGKKYKYKFREKRVVTYNFALARKQQAEIRKQVDKAQSLTAIKTIQREEYGDAVKYVNFDGTCSLNLNKIAEDMKFAGYNMIVTSEIDKSAQEIYDIYHGLWRIEESFRITKSYLDARPVYLQKKESIYGHFLICYLALVILRLLEFKTFKGELNIYEIIDFIRDYSVTKAINDTYINTAHQSKAIDVIKKELSLPFLDNSFLDSKKISVVLKAKL